MDPRAATGARWAVGLLGSEPWLGIEYGSLLRGCGPKTHERRAVSLHASITHRYAHSTRTPIGFYFSPSSHSCPFRERGQRRDEWWYLTTKKLQPTQVLCSLVILGINIRRTGLTPRFAPSKSTLRGWRLLPPSGSTFRSAAHGGKGLSTRCGRGQAALPSLSWVIRPRACSHASEGAAMGTLATRRFR